MIGEMDAFAEDFKNVQECGLYQEQEEEDTPAMSFNFDKPQNIYN